MVVSPLATFDDRNRKEPISTRSLFRRAKKLELNYATNLRKIARYIGALSSGFNISEDDLEGATALRSALNRYANTLDPWARSVGERMVLEIAAADRASWRRTSALMGRALHTEIETAPTGQAMTAALNRQVSLITSLPIEAAQRVHKLTTEGMWQGRRTSEIAKDILAGGDVAKSRANLIAITETSRTATELTKARCEHVGSTHYIWRTMKDRSVRHDHEILDGQAFAWDAPPIADHRTGIRAHPGCIWACRCYPEPIFSDPRS